MKEDDFHMRSNDDIVTIDEFAQEWLVPDRSVEKCATESVVSSINYCDIYLQNKNWTLEQCSVIKDPIGPFEDCHSEVSYKEYYDKCIQDGCRCEGCLCNVIAGYAKECAKKDINVNGWRNYVARCADEFKCGADMILEQCHTHKNGSVACPQTCEDLDPDQKGDCERYALQAYQPQTR